MASTSSAQQLLLLPSAQSFHLAAGSNSGSARNRRSGSGSSGRGDSHASMPRSCLAPLTSAAVVAASAPRHRFSPARLDRHQELTARSGPFFMALAGPGMGGGSGSGTRAGGIQSVRGSKWGRECGSSAFQRRKLSQWATRQGLWQTELLGIGVKEMCGVRQQPCVAAGLCSSRSSSSSSSRSSSSSSSSSSKRVISVATPHSSVGRQHGVEPHSHASVRTMGRLRGNSFAPSDCHRPVLRASIAAKASGAAVAGGGGSSSSSTGGRGSALSVGVEGSSSVRGGGGPRSGADQWVAKVLEEAPCRVPGQTVLPDGRVVVTAEEREEGGLVSGVGGGDWADRLSALIRRFGEGEDSATRDLSSSSLSSASSSAISEGKERIGSSSTQAAGTVGGGSGSSSAAVATDVVRLKDLLRKHKGQLFVPEEALSRTAAAAAAAGLPAPAAAETRADAAAAAEEAAEAAVEAEEVEEAAGKVRDASDGSKRRIEAGKEVGVGSGFAVSNCSREVFDQLLRQSPPMNVSEFKRHVSSGHVEVLTSRAVRMPGGTVAPKGAAAGPGFDYFDVLVTLKPPLQQQQLRGRKKQRKQAGEEVLVLGAEGEQSRLNRTWVLRFSEEEEAAATAAGYHSAAERLLRQYEGRQEEVEDTTATLITASVGAAPPAAPLPAASTISGRLVLELSVLTALAHSALSAVAGVASSLALGVVGVAAAAATRVAWPLAKTVLGPPAGAALALLQWLASALTQLWVGQVVPAATSAAASSYAWLASLAQGAAAGGSQGLMGLDALAAGGFDEASRALLLEKVKSGTKSVAVMFFVLLFMAAGAKFTLNRRTRDFKKWDIWQAIEFGQSKPQARVEGSTGVKFSDVAGIDNVVQELQELVEYLKDPERFSMMGTKPPHGVLMEGPPGCGKTLMAKAIAGEAGVPFYQMAGSEFVEVLVGVGAARIRDLFKRAKVNKPAVVFIDEIDALGAVRAAAGADDDDGGVTERETTLNQLLIELDGFDTGQGVVFLAATNRMDLLDPALLRPGRFDRKITIAPAGSQGRLEILKVHSSRVKMNPHVDLHAVANNLAGWSGARLANLLQEAALVSVRRGGTQIEDEDLAAAADRLTLGAPTARQLAEQQLRPQLVERMAVHEAGLALTAALLRRSAGGSAFGEVEPPQRISIIPRSTASSWTVFSRLDDEAYALASHQSLLNRLQVFLGGRVAEELVWGRDSSTYSTRYAADASWMAYKLVSIWHVGTRTLGAKGVMARGVRPPWARPAEPAGPVLDFEGHLYSDYGLVDSRISDHADATVAALARDLLDEATAATWQLLDSHKEALEDIVEVLLHKGEVGMEVVDDIVDRRTGVRDPSALKKSIDAAALQRIDEGTAVADTAEPSLEAAALSTNGYHGALGPSGAGAAGQEQQSSAATGNPARAGRVCFGWTDGNGETASIGKVGEVMFGSLSASPSSLDESDTTTQPSELEADEGSSSSSSIFSGTPAVAAAVAVAASALSSPSSGITPHSDRQLPLEEGQAMLSAALRERGGAEGGNEPGQSVAKAAAAASADASVGADAFVNGHVGHDASMDGLGDAEHLSNFDVSNDVGSETEDPLQSAGGRDGEGEGQSEEEGGGQEVEDASVNVLHSA